ncbi:MAG: putative zinc-binding metallopeptidase [Rhodospirillales bacterium]
MKLFTCANCQNILYFENVRCEKCQSALGYWPPTNNMVPLKQDGDVWRGLAARGKRDRSLPALRYCDNAEHAACNWLIAADDAARLCLACRHNAKIPALDDPAQAELWRKVERAKKRLFYSLLRLGLEPVGPEVNTREPLIFDVLADPQDPAAPHVMTGHQDGRITLALAEADDSERERRRAMFDEPYRSLLGHLRHETGHYFWDVLVRDGGRLDACREFFGDDSADYDEALARYHRDGPPADWALQHVSAYAASHPWEDFAESFAHYLHIVDTLEMATCFGVRLKPRLPGADARAMAAELNFDPLSHGDFAAIVDAWLPLTYMANNLNRCMGSPDLYPFTLTETVCRKLGFIHAIVGEG